jgi:hypothetical protein
MNNTPSADNTTLTNKVCPEVAKLLWDEYKYRHEHCWNITFKVTTAVVILAIIPYTQVQITERVGRWLVILPIVGVALTVLGIIRLYREMKILGKLRERHRAINYPSFGMEYQNEGSHFTRDILMYLACLLILQIINVILLLSLWIPKLTMTKG